jgi:glycosyltransferase involved in cell wall biosynthesis
MTKVRIYVPTYRHESTFDPVLTSYQNQTYQNLEIHVYDNSAAESHFEIRELIKDKADSRIFYHPNRTQVGALNNYHKMFREANRDGFLIFLASDQGLTSDAISRMLEVKKDSKADIVFSGYRNFDISSLDLKSIFAFETHPFEIEMLGYKSSQLFSSFELLGNFYNSNNIKGEYYGFSLFGSLFDGNLIENLPASFRRFKQHGYEHYLSMYLLLNSSTVFFLAEDLMANIYGRERIGGTERMNNDLSRIECIAAAQNILDEFDFLMEGLGINLINFRKSQVDKCLYFKENYKGFNGYIEEILNKNRLHLDSE